MECILFKVTTDRILALFVINQSFSSFLSLWPDICDHHLCCKSKFNWTSYQWSMNAFINEKPMFSYDTNMHEMNQFSLIK